MKELKAESLKVSQMVQLENYAKEIEEMKTQIIAASGVFQMCEKLARKNQPMAFHKITQLTMSGKVATRLTSQNMEKLRTKINGDRLDVFINLNT